MRKSAGHKRGGGKARRKKKKKKKRAGLTRIAAGHGGEEEEGGVVVLADFIFSPDHWEGGTQKSLWVQQAFRPCTTVYKACARPASRSRHCDAS